MSVIIINPTDKPVLIDEDIKSHFRIEIDMNDPLEKDYDALLMDTHVKTLLNKKIVYSRNYYYE